MALNGKITLIITLTLVAFIFVPIASVSSTDVSTYLPARKPLNVSEPLGKIKQRIDSVSNSLNVTVLISTIINALTNCLSEGGAPSNVEILAAPVLGEVLAKYKEFKIPAEIITNYCNSEDFAAIHNSLWGQLDEHTEFKDLVNFLWRFGYPNIYTAIISGYDFYNCPLNLRNTIPTNGTIPTRSSKGYVETSSTDVDLNLDLEMKNPLLALYEANACNLEEIIQGLVDGGAVQLVLLVDTLIDEITRSPSLHFLVGVIQEPAKGKSFRNFREMREVRCLLSLANRSLMENAFVNELLQLITDITDIDLRFGNLVETVIGIIEMILWKNTVPVPPFQDSCGLNGNFFFNTKN